METDLKNANEEEVRSIDKESERIERIYREMYKEECHEKMVAEGFISACLPGFVLLCLGVIWAMS